MKAWVWDGRAFAPAEAVPLTDRGFRYGMALFESMRVCNGVVEFSTEHQQRLYTACVECDFPVEQVTIAAAADVLANAELDGFARIYVTAGDGGPAAPVTTPRIFVFIEPRKPEKEESWMLGFHDDSWQPVFPGLKTANYWPHCHALAAARARGFDEVLLFNDHAELVSACCANVFLVTNDRILTPSRSSGCRQGVVREWVIKRRKVEERRLRREDVVKADEIFLTNSWLGIMPIATLEGRALGHRDVASRLVGDWERHRARMHEEVES